MISRIKNIITYPWRFIHTIYVLAWLFFNFNKYHKPGETFDHGNEKIHY